ncbi:MAG TPA: hypothetical protein VFP41_11445 [Actinomycetota bacterium]|nr:hypothetical protein [Actinomycetota bacterium]
MGRGGWTEHPERDNNPDPSTTQWTGADLQTSTEYVQTASEVAPAMRKANLAKAARAASHRRGEFRWYELRARRRCRKQRSRTTDLATGR